MVKTTKIINLQPAEQCPKCGLGYLDWDAFDMEGCETWQKVWCQNEKCNAVWIEVYTFSRYEFWDEKGDLIEVMERKEGT